MHDKYKMPRGNFLPLKVFAIHFFANKILWDSDFCDNCRKFPHRCRTTVVNFPSIKTGCISLKAEALIRMFWFLGNNLSSGRRAVILRSVYFFWSPIGFGILCKIVETCASNQMQLQVLAFKRPNLKSKERVVLCNFSPKVSQRLPSPSKKERSADFPNFWWSWRGRSIIALFTSK